MSAAAAAPDALLISEADSRAGEDSIMIGFKPATIHWRGCPTFSEDVFKGLAGPNPPEVYKALWARTECGTVSVPLDYRKPRGRQISIAITRLKATDQSQRIGSLVLNPGGPGVSGYFMPIMTALEPSDVGAQLIERYDFIGFDPRGVGFSSKVDCPAVPPPPPSVGPLTEAQAEAIYTSVFQGNSTCVRNDPEFLTQITTINVARDIDRIRSGLHDEQISYLGVSWGTLLGAQYRSLFPRHVHRMWLDSIAPPRAREDELLADRARATNADFQRFATWLAERNSSFDFGATKTEVEAALAQLRRDLDVSSKIFSDLPNTVIDGNKVAQTAGGLSLSWPEAGALLKAMRDAPNGGPAPEEVKRATRKSRGGAPPEGMPETQNVTAFRAMLCNEDEGRRDFESAWDAYQRRLPLYPVTGAGEAIPPCGGWTLPLIIPRLRYTTASLVMAAHRWEVPAPYSFALRMRAVIGGRILTVNDDVHGSSIGYRSDCAPKVVNYFIGGQLDGNTCQGVPVPTGTNGGGPAPL